MRVEVPPPRGTARATHRRIRRLPRILVAGLGNLLMGDDGAGGHACRAWRAQRPRPCHCVVADVGTAIYGALHLLEWADRILVIDAMHAGGPPGSLYLAEPQELEVKPVSMSLHDLSVIGALSMLAAHRPRVVRVLGVEPESVEPRDGLSGAVAAAIPGLVRWGQKIVAEWRADPSRVRSP